MNLSRGLASLLTVLSLASSCTGAKVEIGFTTCDASTPDVSYTFPTTDYQSMYEFGDWGLANTFCVLGATSASAKLSPDLEPPFYYTPIDDFRDGILVYKNVEDVVVQNVDERGPTFCEGGIYLQPSVAWIQASVVDTTVTATPINESDGVTICAAPEMMGIDDREGNWIRLLLAQGFTASDGEWQLAWSEDVDGTGIDMITYCKKFRCSSADPDPTVLSQPQSPSEPLLPTQKVTMILRL